MVKIPKKWYEPVAGFDPWACPGDAKFDLNVARQVTAFFPEYLTFYKGEWDGKPFELEPWQELLIGHLFAWKNPDGTRRFREIFLYVPRKNGKTQLEAGIMIICCYFDGEAVPEGYLLATDRNQASIAYDFLKASIDRNDYLSRISTAHNSLKSIEIDGNSGVIRILSGENKGKHGYMPHCYGIDELHEQTNPYLIDAMETGVGPRKSPLGIYTSTADEFGDERPCNVKLAYAKNVRDGVVLDPTFFPAVWETIEDKDDWTSPDTWRKANPNFFINGLQFYQSQYLKASVDPVKEIAFKRFYLNMQTKKQAKWLDMTHWKACK